MADEAFFLNRRDRDLLAELIGWWRRNGRTVHNRSNRPQPNEEDDVGTYLARVPDDGIPALQEFTTGSGTGTVVEDDVPGYAYCEIYKLVPVSDEDGDVAITAAGFSRLVYNLSPEAVIGKKWVVINQDNYGTWFVDGAGERINCTNTSRVSNVCLINGDLTVEYELYNPCTGEIILTECVTNPQDCCPVLLNCDGIEIPIPPVICLTFINDSGCACADGASINLYYESELSNPDVGSLFWRSAPGEGLGSCTLGQPPPTNDRFQLATAVFGEFINWFLSVFGNGGGSPVEALCQQEVVMHCSGIPQPLTFTFTESSFAFCDSVPPQVTCNGTVDVLVTIGPCDEETDTGTGTGTSTPGPIVTSCCPGGLPSTLYLTLYGGTSTCNTDGTYPLVWNGSLWQGNLPGPNLLIAYLGCNINGISGLSLFIQCSGAADHDAFSAGTSSCTLPIDFGALDVSTDNCCGGTTSALISE